MEYIQICQVMQSKSGDELKIKFEFSYEKSNEENTNAIFPLIFQHIHPLEIITKTMHDDTKQFHHRTTDD